MTREQLDLLLALIAVTGGAFAILLTLLQLVATALDVREKLFHRRARRVNLRRKDHRLR